MDNGANAKIDLSQLYRNARTLDGDAFAGVLFGWLRSAISFDLGAVITSYPDRPGYMDARFSGYADPSAALASWEKVAHLDIISPQALRSPLKAHRQDIDAPEIDGPTFAPLRDHLRRFGILYSAAIAAIDPSGANATVVLLSRSAEGSRFGDSDLVVLEAMAPHAAESLSVNRELVLLRNVDVGAGALPMAIADRNGRLVQTTPAFMSLLRGHRPPPQTSVIDPACLAAMMRGETWPVPESRYRVHGIRDGAGWLLRIKPESRLDFLSAREREVVSRYAGGATRKTIARHLRMAPSTVKNHLTNGCRKLGVNCREALVALVRLDAAGGAVKSSLS